MQLRQFQEAPLTGRRRHGAIDIEPREDMLHHSDGLHAIGGEAPPADGKSAEAAFVLAEHPDRTGVRRGDRPLEVGMTSGLECGDGVRIFLCDWAAPL